MGHGDIGEVLKKNRVCRSLYEYIRGKEIEVYLVGGFIRDLLLGREGVGYDLDFVIKGENVIRFAKSFADFIKGSFFVLNEEFGKVSKKACYSGF